MQRLLQFECLQKVEIQLLLVRVATEVIEKAEIEIAICTIACETKKGFER